MSKSKLLRMDNILIVVDDIEAVKRFFIELGMELEGEMPVEGDFVDRLVGLQGVKCKIATLVTPDGQSRIELDEFQSPKAIESGVKNAPVNSLGLRRIMFAVEDIDEVLARLRAHGVDLVGEITRYEDLYRLVYVRGPEGIMIALAQQLSGKTVQDAQEGPR